MSAPTPGPSPSSHAPATAGTGAEDDLDPRRPGWVEGVVGVAVFLVLSYGVLPLVEGLGLAPVVYGLIVAAWSGAAGIAGFLVARSIRVRRSSTFHVRRTSWRWLAAGVGAGLLAFVLARLVTVLYTLAFGPPSNVQEIYTDTGSAGPVALVLSLLFLAVLTPIGEELLFRGVVTTTLLRYGRAAGVLGSALVFAAVHGPNLAAATALIVGLVNAELLRRSRSVWPGVLAHAVNNVLALGLGVLLGAAS